MELHCKLVIGYEFVVLFKWTSAVKVDMLCEVVNKKFKHEKISL